MKHNETQVLTFEQLPDFAQKAEKEIAREDVTRLRKKCGLSLSPSKIDLALQDLLDTSLYLLYEGFYYRIGEKISSNK